jgi:hypothetical protein
MGGDSSMIIRDDHDVAHRPRARRLHVAAEMRDAGDDQVAEALVRLLRPRARDSALGLAPGTSSVPRRGRSA